MTSLANHSATLAQVEDVGWSLYYNGECLRKIRDISSGSYGTVSLYANKERTVQFAVKTFARRQDYWAEVKAIKYLKNQNVASCNKMPANPLATKRSSYEPRVIIMPVLNRIQEMKLQRPDWLRTINDIQENISCLRKGGLFYTDLKLENLLWQKATNPPHVYLGDLGGIGSLNNSEFITTYAQEYQDAFYNEGFQVFDIIVRATPDSHVEKIYVANSPDWWCTYKLGPVDQSCVELQNKFEQVWERETFPHKRQRNSREAIEDANYKNQLKVADC